MPYWKWQHRGHLIMVCLWPCVLGVWSLWIIKEIVYSSMRTWNRWLWYRTLDFGQLAAKFFHFFTGAHCSICIYTILWVHNDKYFNNCSSKAYKVPTGLQKIQISNTKFYLIKILGHNRVIWDDSSTYKIMGFGQLVAEIWVFKVVASKVHILLKSAIFGANSNNISCRNCPIMWMTTFKSISCILPSSHVPIPSASGSIWVGIA